MATDGLTTNAIRLLAAHELDVLPRGIADALVLDLGVHPPHARVDLVCATRRACRQRTTMSWTALPVMQALELEGLAWERRW